VLATEIAGKERSSVDAGMNQQVRNNIRDTKYVYDLYYFGVKFESSTNGFVELLPVVFQLHVCVLQSLKVFFLTILLLTNLANRLQS